jgi:AraC-like DNA-binding protein
MARPIALVRTAVLGPIVAFLERLGSPVERHLAVAGLPRRVLEDPEALVPLYAAARFLEGSARAEGIEDLGLLVGKHTQIDALGSFGRLLRQSLTVHEAIETARRIGPAFNSGEHLWLGREGGEPRFCHRFTDGHEAGSRQANLYSLMIQLNFLRLAAGPDWQPTEVHLQCSEPRGLGEIETLANGRIVFEQHATSISLPSRLLAQPLSRGRVPRGMLDARAWRSSSPSDHLPGCVRQVIGTLLPAGYPDLRLVGEAVGMSHRTLQRRLAEAGVSYARLVTEARLEAAVRLLENPDVKLIEVAFELGYSDPAHFTRAFRRWAGVAPREFRQGCRAGNDRDEADGRRRGARA